MRKTFHRGRSPSSCLIRPGGPADILARIMAERMRAPLGQPVVVENVAGAAGTMGVSRVVRAAPDGYTLSYRQLGHACSQRRDPEVSASTCSPISSRSRSCPTIRNRRRPTARCR